MSNKYQVSNPYFDPSKIQQTVNKNVYDNFIGCYKDDGNNRAIPNVYNNYSYVTFEDCNKYAKDAYASFFGFQYGKESKTDKGQQTLGICFFSSNKVEKDTQLTNATKYSQLPIFLNRDDNLRLQPSNNSECYRGLDSVFYGGGMTNAVYKTF